MKKLLLLSLFTLSTPAFAEPFCREYTQTITIGGQKQNSYGTACLQPDGSWELQGAQQKVVNNNTYVTQEPAAPYPVTQYVVRDSRMYYYPPRPLVIGYYGDRGYRDHRHHHHGRYR